MGYVVADEGEWVVKKGKPVIRQVPRGHVFLEMVNVPEDFYPQFVSLEPSLPPHRSLNRH